MSVYEQAYRAKCGDLRAQYYISLLNKRLGNIEGIDVLVQENAPHVVSAINGEILMRAVYVISSSGGGGNRKTNYEVNSGIRVYDMEHGLAKKVRKAYMKTLGLKRNKFKDERLFEYFEDLYLELDKYTGQVIQVRYRSFQPRTKKKLSNDWKKSGEMFFREKSLSAKLENVNPKSIRITDGRNNRTLSLYPDENQRRTAHVIIDEIIIEGRKIEIPRNV